MASIKKSGFQKREVIRSNLIKGTKPSIHNSQLLVSSGISSFDALIGGGIPVGSILIINEDEYGTYAKSILKYFLAEGIASKHSIFICSQEYSPEEMVKKLPSLAQEDVEDEVESDESNEKMSIAWRYEKLKTVSSSINSHSYFGHYFDLSKNIDEKLLQKSDIEFWAGCTDITGDSFKNSHYSNLYNCIKEKLNKGKHFSKQENSERNILRIALHSLDSPLWRYDFKNDDHINFSYFYQFLYSLRSLVRQTYSTCIITIPFSRLQDSHADKCLHFSDIAIQLQSFAGTNCENVAPYKDYHGFFIIQKLIAINSLVAFNPNKTNLAFKLRRKKFVIEEFHLPPELEDSAEREQDDSAVLTCSSVKTKKLDF